MSDSSAPETKSADAATLVSAKSYTDAQIAAIPPVDISGKANKTYVDSQDAAKLVEAKAYATITPNANTQEEQSAGYSINRGRVLNISGSTGFRPGKAKAVISSSNTTSVLTDSLNPTISSLGTTTVNKVANISTFLDSGDVIQIDDEKMLVYKTPIISGGVDTGVLIYYIIRGLDGTIPSYHANGSVVRKVNVSYYITNIQVIDGGYGYVTPPRVVSYGGEGSGLVARAVITNNSISSFVIDNPGLGYEYPPEIKLEAPGIQIGQRIQQYQNFGATGIWVTGVIEEWDSDNNLLYVLKDPQPIEGGISPEFNNTDIDYHGINIKVGGQTNWTYTEGFTAGSIVTGATGVDVITYNTRGKQISSVPESEFNIF